MLLSINEAKLNMKLYAMAFTAATLGFTYWQRSFLPNWFYLIAVSSGVLAGACYGVIRTGWHVVENLDALGKDYEISRLMKQDIFDHRPDIDSSMRAQYYIHQQNVNDKFDKEHKRQ